MDRSVVQDVTSTVSAPDDTFVEIETMDFHDDLIIRKECYLYFPARDVNGLPGYFIVRLHTESKEVAQKGNVSIDYARIVKVNNIYSIEITTRATNASIQTMLLYSRHIDVENNLASSVLNVLSQPSKVNFIRGYEFKVNPKAIYKSATNDQECIRISINEYYAKESIIIDKCEELLDSLNDVFSVSNDIVFFWSISKINTHVIDEKMAAIGKASRLHFDVSLVIQGRKQDRVLWENNQDFVPKLRQNITWKEEDGSLAGGEVRINVNENME